MTRSPFLFGENTQRQLVIAHRGARSLAPENTLAAAQAARSLGADLWEFDIEATRDGELVLLHDGTLARTTDAALRFPDRSPWRAADLTYEEIQTLDAGSWFLKTDPFGTLASGAVPATQTKEFPGQRVPTLREALAWTRDAGLGADIELKGNGASAGTGRASQTVEEAVALVRELGLECRAFVSSFDRGMIAHLKAIAPEVAGILLFHSLPENPPAVLEEIGADGAALSLPAFDEQATRCLAADGYGVYVWTVNGPEDLARLARNPLVSGVITDWPQRLLEILGRAQTGSVPARAR